MKKHILDFKENECIHVPTLEEAEWLFEILKQLGYSWIADQDLLDNNWEVYKSQTVYYVDDKTLSYSSKNFAVSEGCTIYPLDDIEFKKKLIRPLEALIEFQTAFKCPVNTEPTLLDKERAKLRYDLAKEELDEYMEAVENGDMAEIADSIGDQLFVLMGTAVEHGLQNVLMDVFEEIFRSNMSKLDEQGQPIINGENGVYDETRPLGKVLKSPNYFQPNLKQFL